MFRTVSRLGPISLGGFLPFDFDSNDKVVSSKYNADMYRDAMKNQSGWERLRLMFTIDEFGSVSQEINSVLQSSFLGLFIGGLYGGTITSRIAYMNFMERNQASLFKHQFDAKKKLQDAVTIGFAKGAFKWAWRLSLFTGSYILLTTSISVYRGSSSLLEYVVAGALTGSMYKASLGLRGIAIGGGVGCVLGLLGGGASLILMKLTGISMEEIRFWQYQLHESRSTQLKMAADRSASERNDPLFTVHDSRIVEQVATVENRDVEKSSEKLKTIEDPGKVTVNKVESLKKE